MVSETPVHGVLLVTLTPYRDDRGFFVEAFNDATFAAAGLPVSFVQDNHSRSRRGVLRGLHFQGQQGKLVRVVRGSIYDVAADIRPGSPTYGRWTGVRLDDEAMKALWIPPGCAHGFCTLSDEADVVYKCTELYDSQRERGIAWDDPTFRIEWPVRSPVVSERDRALPRLTDLGNLPLHAG